MIEIIGAPFDLCGKRLGSRLGPDAVRLAGLSQSLTSLGKTVKDRGNIKVGSEATAKGGIRNFDPAMKCYEKLKSEVSSSIKRGALPIVIGGDHSIAIGSVSGAMEAYGDDLAVLWVDAHADLNTIGTSWSGSLHGMPFGALFGMESGATGLRDRQWSKLTKEIVPANRLCQDHVAWVGLRDVDKAEKEALKSLKGGYTATMFDIDSRGLVTVLEEFHGWMAKRKAKKLWISFDVDVLDPILAPGTGTAVRGGLNYREMHLMAELLCAFLGSPKTTYQLAGVELVEVNPLIDSNNVTAITAVEFLGSLFGKRILQ
ncbi:MAG: arginase [Fimbriimonadaceae bacterium]|nr:arginase [Fimbriimonadaceae bacterium]